MCVSVCAPESVCVCMRVREREKERERERERDVCGPHLNPEIILELFSFFDTHVCRAALRHHHFSQWDSSGVKTTLQNVKI